MAQYQLIQTTNYLSDDVFYNKFLFWLKRLQPFVEETGRPPMDANSFVTAFRVHGYAVCNWSCGMKLYEIMKSFYETWKLVQLNHSDVIGAKK